jgi:hypothetical protein
MNTLRKQKKNGEKMQEKNLKIIEAHNGKYMVKLSLCLTN